MNFHKGASFLGHVSHQQIVHVSQMVVLTIEDAVSSLLSLGISLTDLINSDLPTDFSVEIVTDPSLLTEMEFADIARN